MNFKMREANNSDYTELFKLAAEVYKLHLKNRPDVYLNIGSPMPKEYFDELLSSDNSKVFVAQNIDNKELAAYSVMQIMTTKNPMYIQKKFVFIDDYCVKSNYKRNGIGRLLFNYIKEYAKTADAASLQLNVWEFNKDAIKFYEAMGMSTRNRRMELNL